jgi:hypothetical protein
VVDRAANGSRSILFTWGPCQVVTLGTEGSQLCVIDQTWDQSSRKRIDLQVSKDTRGWSADRCM